MAIPKESIKQPIAGRALITAPIILGQITLGSPRTQTTIGANGAASALTANPVGYLRITIANTEYSLPYYNI